MTSGFLLGVYLQEAVLKRVFSVVAHPLNVKLILYLAGMLCTGLALLYDISRPLTEQFMGLGRVSNLTHRKLFHVLAFFLFMPMHAMVLTDRKVFELLLLSQNLVTVLFIYIELVRFTFQDSSIGEVLNKAFMRFVDHRELSSKKLLLTHLYLLIGLGIPTNLTFILLDGGFPDGEMAVFAFSGVLFLGIGDTIAALAGKTFGSTKWRSNAHNKTQEGTVNAVLFMCIIYYIFCAKVHVHMCSMFVIVFLPTMIVCLVEGLTTQFDNLVCPLVYFISLHQFYDYFLHLI